MNRLRNNGFSHYLTAFALLGLTIPIGVCANEQIHEVDADSIDGYTQPLLPLNTVGEKINVLIRIKKTESYTATLVFVEQRDWPEKKRIQLQELYDGIGVGIERGSKYRFADFVPYPIKLRFQLDSVDAPSPVNVDLIHEERSSEYGTRYPIRYPRLPDGQPSVIWRAHGIWGIRKLEPGLYRLRIENLSPCQEIDFETLLQFFHHYIKA